MKKKPSFAAIAAAVPFSKASTRPTDPITACNICGQASDELSIWREHDERDAPILRSENMIFIGKDHSECLRAMEAHPRLYAEEMGWPGHLPRLCGPCTFRQGFTCSHPDLKANGGKGLLITLHDPLRAAGVICVKGLRARYVRHALECPGRKT